MGSIAWRREKAASGQAAPRLLCLLLADRPAPAALHDVTGTGALVETFLRPALATRVSLRHPDAGAIAATVTAHTDRGIRVAFDLGEPAVAFALATLAADIAERW